MAKIDDFLSDLNQHSELIEVRSNNMSTRLFGDYTTLTSVLNQAMLSSMEQHGKIVFVCKYLQGDARTLEGYD